MSKTLDRHFVKEAMRGDVLWCSLLEIDTDGAGTMWRVTDCEQDLTFEGHTFTSFDFAFPGLQETADQKIPGIDVTITNVDQTAAAYVINNSGMRNHIVRLIYVFVNRGAPAFEVEYTNLVGPPTTCVVDILGDGENSITLNLKEDGVVVQSYDLTAAAYDTVGELVAAINGLPNYACTIDSGCPASWPTSKLIAVDNMDILKPSVSVTNSYFVRCNDGDYYVLDDPNSFLDCDFYIADASGVVAGKTSEVTLSLRPQAFYRGRIPGRSLSKPMCSFAYREGTTCQYAGGNVAGPNGEADHCDRTMDGDYGCKVHGNQAHFGGFPGVGKGKHWFY